MRRMSIASAKNSQRIFWHVKRERAAAAAQLQRREQTEQDGRRADRSAQHGHGAAVDIRVVLRCAAAHRESRVPRPPPSDSPRRTAHALDSDDGCALCARTMTSTVAHARSDAEDAAVARWRRQRGGVGVGRSTILPLISPHYEHFDLPLLHIPESTHPILT